MDIGAGIAIAGVWVFAGMMGMSSTVSADGLWFGIIAATVITFVLI